MLLPPSARILFRLSRMVGFWTRSKVWIITFNKSLSALSHQRTSQAGWGGKQGDQSITGRPVPLACTVADLQVHCHVCCKASIPVQDCRTTVTNALQTLTLEQVRWHEGRVMGSSGEDWGRERQRQKAAQGELN